MRQISVSTRVFAAIWGARVEGEESENEILERLLLGGGEVMPAQPEFCSDESGDLLDDSVDTQTREVKPMELHMNADGWLEVVVAAFQKLGRGPHSLDRIYKSVERVVRESGKPMVESLDETVRGTIYDNCAESKRWKRKRDVFRRASRGHWELKDAWRNRDTNS